MDKTTKELRARLRDVLAIHFEDWENIDSIGEMQESDLVELDAEYRQIVKDGLAGHDVFERLRHWFERPKMDFLRGLATCEESSLIANSLQLPIPLKLIPGDAPWTRDEWVVAWPDGTKLPHDLHRADALFQLAEPLLQAWIDHLSDDAPSVDGLIPEARSFLKAMLDLGFHDGERGKQDDIWARVGEIDEEKQGKKAREAALKLLKDRGLVDSLSGTGTTLTDAGLKLARSLK